MTETLTLTWSQVLAVAGVVIVVFSIEALVFVLAVRRGRGDGDELARIRADLDAVRAELTAVKQSQQSAGLYRQAVEMAERGEDVEAVAAQCGISRGEAELIVALNRGRAVGRER